MERVKGIEPSFRAKWLIVVCCIEFAWQSVWCVVSLLALLALHYGLFIPQTTLAFLVCRLFRRCQERGSPLHGTSCRRSQRHGQSEGPARRTGSKGAPSCAGCQQRRLGYLGSQVSGATLRD